MRKTSVLIIILLVILIGCSTTVVLMTTGIISKGTNEDADSFEIYRSSKDMNDYVCTPLAKSNIDISENIKGIVVTNENTIKNYTVENINNNFLLKVTVGQYVKKDEILYIDNNGKNVVAEKDMQILNIEKEKDFYMQAFIYSNTAISVSVDSKYQNSLRDIRYSIVAGEEILELNMLSVESVVNEGRIRVLLDNPLDLLEQSEVEVEVKYGEIENAIDIKKDWVYFNDQKEPYVNVIDGDYVYEVKLNVIEKTEDTYIVDNEELDGCNIGYIIEEKYFSE
jgi:hypothetical protein